MPSFSTLDPTADPIVHISLKMLAGQTQIPQYVSLAEQPFISELKLNAEPNDPALLIAVGEMLGVEQPLSVFRISYLGQLAILWLDHNRWLILSTCDQPISISAYLSEYFADGISLQEESYPLTAKLTTSAITTILDSSISHEFCALESNSRETSATRLINEPVHIHVLSNNDSYELLVRRGCAIALDTWLRIN